MKSTRALLPAIAVLLLIASFVPSASATLTLKGSIDDVTLVEDETAQNEMDLDDYFESDVSQISFSFVSVENKIEVTIQDDGRVDFGAPSNWFGCEEVTFIASDGEQKVGDTILVTVNPKNDAPLLLSPIPDVEFKEDTVKSNALNLFNHFQDIDSSLDFSATSEHVIVHINNDGFVDFSAPANWNGAEHITLSASDGEFTVYGTIEVTVEPVNDSPQNKMLFTSLCLKPGQEGTTLNLNEYFIDYDDEKLLFQVTGNRQIMAQAMTESGYMILSVPKEWSGEEILTITAVDKSGESSSIQMIVIVTPQKSTPSYTFYLVGLVVALAVTGVRLQHAGRKRTIKSPVDLNSYRHYKGD